MEFSMVYITASNQEEAEEIGRFLVEERLAACVNILGEINSIYWWNGAVEQGNEIAMIAKTSTGSLEKLIEKVKELHSYDCPCIVSWTLGSINPDYQNWLEQSLKPECR